MKRIIAWLLCACAALAAVGAAGEETDAAAEAMALFRGRHDGVAFALPGFGERLTDVDSAGRWRDSVQLAGVCAEDGTEFQLRSADISEWQAGYRRTHPNAEPRQVMAQTLYAYSALILNSYGAETEHLKAKAVDGETLILNYDYTYPDTPGQAYRAKCIVRQGRATCLTMGVCAHTQAVLDALRLTEEPPAQEAPRVMDIQGLEAVYPCEPYQKGLENTALLVAFTEDWSYLSVQYVPARLALPETEDEVRTLMMTAARDKMLPIFGGRELRSPRLFSLGDGYMLSFSSVSAERLADYGQPWLCRLYVTSGGVWYVTAADTETGTAFMSRLRMGDGTITELQPAEVPEAEGDQPAADAVRFDTFRDRLAALAEAKAFGADLTDPYWSEPFFSDGQWKRVVYSKAYADLPCLIVCLDGPEDTALVGEVRALGRDPDVRYAETAILASCAAEALAGESAHAILRTRLAARSQGDAPEERYGAYLWRQSYFSSPDTAEKHHLITLSLADGWEVREAVTPRDEALPDIEGGAVTAETLLERFNSLSGRYYGGMLRASFVDVPMEGNEAAWIISVNNSFMIQASTADGTPASPVLQLLIASIGGEPSQSAPLTLGCTLLCYAALTDLSEEEYMALNNTLLEYPLWDDLAGMQPLAARNGIMALLSDDEMNGSPIFMGWVAGAQTEEER